jgi:hypothetical protein
MLHIKAFKDLADYYQGLPFQLNNKKQGVNNMAGISPNTLNLNEGTSSFSSEGNSSVNTGPMGPSPYQQQYQPSAPTYTVDAWGRSMPAQQGFTPAFGPMSVGGGYSMYNTMPLGGPVTTGNTYGNVNSPYEYNPVETNESYNPDRGSSKTMDRLKELQAKSREATVRDINGVPTITRSEFKPGETGRNYARFDESQGFQAPGLFGAIQEFVSPRPQPIRDSNYQNPASESIVSAGYGVGEVDPMLANLAGYTKRVSDTAGNYGILSGTGRDVYGDKGVLGDIGGYFGDMAGVTNYNTPEAQQARRTAETARLAKEKTEREAALKKTKTEVAAVKKKKKKDKADKSAASARAQLSKTQAGSKKSTTKSNVGSSDDNSGYY